MRDQVIVYINGREHRLTSAEAFQPLTDYLRQGAASMCGTKVVCAEGDCGACTVLVGRTDGAQTSTNAKSDVTYVPVNGCIQYMYQLDGASVITVEALSPSEGSPAQTAMVDNNGTQCGYCTPGFIMSLSALAYCPSMAVCEYGSSNGTNGKGSTSKPASANKNASAKSSAPSACQIKSALTGNLCRCTGYESIVKAGIECQYKEFKPLSEIIDEPTVNAALSKLNQDDVLVQHGERQFYLGDSVEDLSRFMNDNQGTVLVSGGTDVSVVMNKRGFAPASIASTARLPGLSKIEIIEEEGKRVLVAGGRASLYALEKFCQEQDDAHLREFYRILWVFGSPQIRQAGTLAGNIANGSPIADSLPMLMACDAQIEASSHRGVRRIALREFYLGYKKLALALDEIITRIFIPIPDAGEILKLYKVSRREHLDISSFTAALRIAVDSAGKISKARVILGGVDATVHSIPDAEAALVGQPHDLQTYQKAGKIAAASIKPLTDVRGSSDFRAQLAENIFSKFYYESKELQLEAAK